MIPITYIEGDATEPIDDGNYPIIVHVVNNIKVWGGGFTAALDKKWPHIGKEFRSHDLTLGVVSFATVEDGNILIANLCAQNGVRSKYNQRPLNYRHLETTLYILAEEVGKMKRKSTLHMPKIGSGLAGGDWVIVSEIIEEILCHKNLNVIVYTLKENENGLRT